MEGNPRTAGRPVTPQRRTVVPSTFAALTMVTWRTRPEPQSIWHTCVPSEVAMVYVEGLAAPLLPPLLPVAKIVTNNRKWKLTQTLVNWVSVTIAHPNIYIYILYIHLRRNLNAAAWSKLGHPGPTKTIPNASRRPRLSAKLRNKTFSPYAVQTSNTRCLQVVWLG